MMACRTSAKLLTNIFLIILTFLIKSGLKWSLVDLRNIKMTQKIQKGVIITSASISTSTH